MTFSDTITTLAAAGGRALGSVISKLKTLKNVGYSTYTKFYEKCVCPITDYASGIWGLKSFAKMDQLQNRAIRYYLGVHRFAPIPGLVGEMGWKSPLTRWTVEVIRMWNRFIHMPNDRFNKIFLMITIETLNIIGVVK